MYTDYVEYEKRKFPIRAVLVKMVIIILIIMLLIWILPSSMFDGSKKVMEENANKLKEASLSYFKDDDLPSKVDEKVKINLKKLQETKLIGELKNKKKKSCNIDSSYSSLRKRKEDYLLTIHLECGDNKLVKEYVVSNYSYCDNLLCERDIKKEKASEPTCKLEVTKGELGVYDWYRSDVEVTLKEKEAKEGLKIKEFGTSLKKEYNSKDTYLVKEDGTYKIYGYVKDSNEKEGSCSITINKDTKKPTCELTVLSGNKNSNGLYYGNVVVGFKNKKDELSGIDVYGLSESKEPLYNEEDKITVDSSKSSIIYGYIKDKAGNVDTCSIDISKNSNSSNNSDKIMVNNNSNSNVNIVNKSSTETFNKEQALSCSLTVHSGTKNKNNIYTTDVVVSFSNITTHGTTVVGYGIGKDVTYNKNSTYRINTNGTHTIYGYVKDNKGNTTKCNIVIKRNIDTNSTTYKYAKYIPTTYSAWSNWIEEKYDINNPPVFYKNDTKEVEDLGKRTVSTYKYSVGSAIYLSQIHEVKTLTEKVCTGYTYYRLGNADYAVKTNAKWTYNGKITVNTTPSESVGVKYEFDSLDWNCGSCTTPNIIWKKYIREALNTNSLNCDNKQNGNVIIINQYREIVGFNQTRSLINSNVYMYRYRTRNLLKTGYTDYKYSNSKNDIDLIKQGYNLV